MAMKRNLVLLGVLVLGGTLLGMAQTKSASSAGSTATVKDPELIDAAGYRAVVAKYKGKPLLVTFWATWCEPCRDEFPMLNELAKQYESNGLKVVGINLDQDGDLILMRRFLARYKPVFPNYRKQKGQEDAFVGTVMPGWNGAIPATFFYNKEGERAGDFVGAASREKYEAEIRVLLGK